MARLEAAVAKAEKSAAVARADADAAREAAQALRGHDSGAEKRVFTIERQLLATSDAELERVAGLLEERVSMVRLGRAGVKDGANAGLVALRLQELYLELRQQTPLLSAKDAAARLAQIKAEALGALISDAYFVQALEGRTP